MWIHLKRYLTSTDFDYLFITVILCLIASIAWASPIYETEVNDSIPQTDFFTSANSTVVGNAFDGDWDFYQFSASPGDIIYFQLNRQSNDGGTLRYEIRDTSNNTMWRDILVGYASTTGNQTFGVGTGGLYYLALKGSKYTLYNATVWNSTQ